MPPRRRSQTASRWHRHRWRIAAWSLLPLALLVPLVAMQWSDAVRWTGFDFAVAAILLAGTGAMLEMALRLGREGAYRVASAIALLTAFLLAWVTLAVGLIGGPDDAANLLPAGVLVLGLAATVWCRGRAQGMALTLAGMAAVQAAIAVIALLAAGWQAALLTLGFAGLWLLAAALFRTAARHAA